MKNELNEILDEVKKVLKSIENICTILQKPAAIEKLQVGDWVRFASWQDRKDNPDFGIRRITGITGRGNYRLISTNNYSNWDEAGFIKVTEDEIESILKTIS